LTEGPEVERSRSLSVLAEVDPPEVAKAALMRFRRRALLTILLVALVVAAGVMIAANRGPGSVQERFASAERADVGRVLDDAEAHLAVLSVARLDPGSYGVHLVAFADELRAGEVMMAGSVARSEASPAGSIGDAGCLEVTVGTPAESLEMWIIAPIGTGSLQIELVAGVPSNLNAGYTATTGPVDPDDSCELGLLAPGELQGGARPLASVEIDMEALRVPRPIWKEKR
jgi:hypothetical protein